MKRAVRTLILSGELLIGVSLVIMATGLAMNFPGSTIGSLIGYGTAKRLHTIAAYIFIPLFYAHSAMGLYIALGRFNRLRNAKVRKTVLSTWTIGMGILVLLSLVPQESSLATTPEVSAGTNLTIQEVLKHNTENDCWVIIGNDVYNVTSLIDVHSGGRDAIIDHCGTNATKVFFGKHDPEDYNFLQKYYIGTIGGPTKAEKVEKEDD